MLLKLWAGAISVVLVGKILKEIKMTPQRKDQEEQGERIPLAFTYDRANDWIEIEGIKYSGSVFRDLGYCHGFKVGAQIEVIERQDKVIVFKNLKPEIEQYRETIAGLERQCDENKVLIRKLVDELKVVDSWFQELKKDQYEKLVHHQTFESACKNWDKLLNKPLEMERIWKAVSLAEKQLGEK